MTNWITKKSDSDKETKSWIVKKKNNKKFYGYTGPVKPETSQSKWISKKSDNKSYGYTEVVKQKKESWIKKKVKEENN